MSYREEISAIRNITVEDVIRISKQFVPFAYRNKPWLYPDLNHGVNLLCSEEALYCYMAAYGEMHTIKCRTAFRSLPWDSFANIEIIDWGCGQGIGTICFAEMLRERNKLHLLQKVTLIEPSKSALDRAVFNVNKFTNGAARVIPIEKYLPAIETSDDDSTLASISYDYRTIIHVFSNILDVNNIDLAKLSRMMPKIGTQQYIVCIGPRNGNSHRLEQFAAIFVPDHLLTRIDAPIFGVTSTNHQFGCKALSWEYNNTPLSQEAIQAIPHNIIAEPILDDYQLNLVVENGLLHPKAAQLMELINNLIGVDDIVYYKPTIDGNIVDIVILRPNAGIYIIQVFDCDITQEIAISPVKVLKQLKEELITLHIKQCAENYMSQRGYWSIIKMIGFFPKNTSVQIEQYCEKYEINHEYETLIGEDDLQGIRNVLMQIGFFQSNRSFSSIVKKDFLRLISPGWHSFKEGKAIPFTKEQKELSNSHVGKQKIKGVAGSGKTEVLVHRAVDAQIRTGEKVLILTYNLSLRNYIKYRLSQVRADFAWDKFYITNYHQLIKTEVIKHGLESTGISFDTDQLFKGIEHDIQKYSAIFIDEIQDYKPTWLSIINHYFLADEGELVVFGDPKQKMYNNCELDSNGDIRIGVIPGEWNGKLVQGRRFSNAQIAHFTNLFGHEFLGEELLRQEEQQQFAFDTRISYRKLKDSRMESIIESIEQELQTMNINIQDGPDLAILSDTHGIVRGIENILSTNYPNLPIITTSENQSQYSTILSRYEDENDPRFKRDIDQLRRTKKVHFTIDTNAIKLSTIKSYKGLEAENIIVIVEPNCEPATLYTGLTRAKNNLIIISIGNPQYDAFFSSHL